MALGDSSPFAPIDLLGGLITNAVATNMACKNVQFRTGIANKSGVVQPFADYRFLGGLAAALAGQFVDNPMVTRVGHDVASGLLNSFVATETCRKHALARNPPAQIPADAPAEGSDNMHMAGAHSNFAYGW
jgi:hypothetical protein